MWDMWVWDVGLCGIRGIFVGYLWDINWLDPTYDNEFQGFIEFGRADSVNPRNSLLYRTRSSFT